nr:hypothetical protein CFP56_37265 [Quercus suber]
MRLGRRGAGLKPQTERVRLEWMVSYHTASRVAAKRCSRCDATEKEDQAVTMRRGRRVGRKGEGSEGALSCLDGKTAVALQRRRWPLRDGEKGSMSQSWSSALAVFWRGSVAAAPTTMSTRPQGSTYLDDRTLESVSRGSDEGMEGSEVVVGRKQPAVTETLPLASRVEKDVREGVNVRLGATLAHSAPSPLLSVDSGRK